jgi:hypothetical protein
MATTTTINWTMSYEVHYNYEPYWLTTYNKIQAIPSTICKCYRWNFWPLFHQKCSVLTRGLFIEHKLMHSYSCRCHQIYICQIWVWSHFLVLLKSDMDVQQAYLRHSLPLKLILFITFWNRNTSKNDLRT